MKKKVTYQIRGQVERSCIFKVGNALVRIDFTGGSINGYGIHPAQYTTDNALYRHSIENSEAFKKGEIKKVGEVLIAEPGDDDKKEESGGSIAGDKDRGCAENSSSFSQVTNLQQARNILMGEPYSLSIVELQTKAAVKGKAAELGVMFPNWL